jgi:tetratricopeptide (TPR) repeat protein
VEPLPHFYTDLAQGIRQLMDEEPEVALKTFSRVLKQERERPSASIFTSITLDGPNNRVTGGGATALANYFRGEALFALGREDEAIQSFRASLDEWPEHAPALAAIARLTAGADASSEALATAVAMTEQATRIEPTNLGYWRQLADLCERNGETGRASAIRLQWLTPRLPR